MYKEKSVRAIGKISAIVTAVRNENGELEYTVEKPEGQQLTQDMKEKINSAIIDGKNYGYDLASTRYFFVEKFYETDFKKITPYAPMGSRVFDLAQILNTKELPKTEKIANQLREITWG